MKTSISGVFCFLLFLILFVPQVSADNLVYIPVEKGQTSEDIMASYENTIFFEKRFVLALVPDEWQPSREQVSVLGVWNDDAYYFVLYPLQKTNRTALSDYGTILKSEANFIIFESPHQVLNDFELFETFKIVRVFNRQVVTTPPAPLPLAPEIFSFNPLIQQMVNRVSADSLWHYIGLLQNMERYTTNPQAMNAANFLKNYYYSLGYDTVYFHTWHTGWIPNVVAVKYGQVYPDEIYLVGGHYDVYTSGAPGADDNGSGTAAIVDVARALSDFNYKRTLKFVNFSGEEMGLLGSEAYASQAVQQGENMLGMINMDMIAYVEPGDAIDVDIVRNSASVDLYNAYLQASQTYVPSLAIVDGSLPWGASSDHASFWQHGFKAIFPFEDSDDYSPYIHSSQDVLGISANNQELAQLGTKSVVATLASLAQVAETRMGGSVISAETLLPIQNAVVYFNSDSALTDSQGVFLSPPLSPGNYDVIVTAPGFTPDTSFQTLQLYQVLNINANLIPAGQQRPYIHLANVAIDDDSVGNSLGNGNGLADAGEIIEIFGNFFNTGSQPASNLAIHAQTGSRWVNLISDSMEASGIAPGDTVTTDNALVLEIHPQAPKDTPVQVSLELYYQGYQQNAAFEFIIYNRGQILIVEDDDNSGGLTKYTQALDSLQFTYDVAGPDISQGEMALYDVMIWFCGEEMSSTLTASDQQKIAAYLDNGGKLFISGVDIGYDINNDPFYETYLKTHYVGDGPFQTINQVTGVGGDPISGDFAGGMAIDDNWVDQINPVGGAQQIFSYLYQSAVYGCGVRYQGNYQLVYLTFTYENIPNAGNRQVLMGNIMNWFGMVSGISSGDDAKALQFTLAPNYPNPFNSQTIIPFTVSGRGKTTLEIFDVLGRRVKTLVDKPLMPGNHQVYWEGRNQYGRQVASGVYFYRLKNGPRVLTRKLLLIR